MYKQHEGLYAILRSEEFGLLCTSSNCLTVKEVVRSLDVAEREVARLNSLNSEKGARYWWQYIRLFPSGRSASSMEEV
jgi:hypothetical protein